MPTLLQVKKFRKELLSQDELIGFGLHVVELSQAAGFPELAGTTSMLETATLNLKKMVHPVEDRRFTKSLAALDKERDKYVSAIYHCIAFGRCHFDPEVVRAANKLRIVVRTGGYRDVQRSSYMGATNKIRSLLKEFNNNCAEAVATLNLGAIMEKLQEANINFERTFIRRSQESAVLPEGTQIRKARTEVEHAFNHFSNALNSMAYINDYTVEQYTESQVAQHHDPNAVPNEPATSTAELIVQINASIDKALVASRHRITLYRKAKAKKQSAKKSEA